MENDPPQRMSENDYLTWDFRIDTTIQLDSVCLGVIADLHHGLAPRAMERLDVFMQAVAKRKPDAILQLGDFNFGTKESDECLDLWNSYTGPRYHVLGNHDMDFMSKDVIVQKWGMPAPYYSFDFDPYHVVVLDRNNLKIDEGYTPYSEANFYVDASLRGYADDTQLAWLYDDLAKSSLPTVVFVHQGLALPCYQYLYLTIKLLLRILVLFFTLLCKKCKYSKPF